MGEKDIAEKNLEALNDVFADIVNVLLFNGKRLILEHDLESDTSNSMFKADGKIHEQERDVSKFWKNGKIRISILGFENQTKEDYKMPLRVISYDGASYKQQLLDNKYKKNYPVVTLVLYFGTDKLWTAPKNLLDCFEVPKELIPFVSNYKINVFEIAWLDDKTIDMFKSDFKFLARYSQAKRLHIKYKGSREKIEHVEQTLKMFSALTGDDSFEKVYNNNYKKEGGVIMCEVVERIKDEGREEAREELIRTMLEEKFATAEQIAKLLKIPVSKVKKIAAKVPIMN